MNSIANKSFIYIAVAVTVLVTAGLIYLTPLKWITIVEPSIKDIAPEVFYKQFSQDPEKYVFIDVRPEEAYERVHAKGSINIPLHMLYDERRTLPKSGKEIIIICSGGRASGVAYSYLQHYGFFNIHRVEGGIENWMVKNLPVEGSEITAQLPEQTFAGNEILAGAVCV